MISNQSIRVKKISKNDRFWIKRFYKKRWGSDRVVSRGVIRDVPSLPGFIAWRSGERVGLLTYHIENNELEIVTLDSLAENIGVGSALVAEAVVFARDLNCFRVWLITTNDNTPALRFYQKRGFQLAVIHRNALDESRKLKPEIPQLGLNGIPLRDEIELEIPLNP
jgi:ribosomal protein S18 acetylase RimI-like enzyme